MTGDAMVDNGGIKQKNVAVPGRNRRALNDIGNLVTTRDVKGKVQRPITRLGLIFSSLYEEYILWYPHF